MSGSYKHKPITSRVTCRSEKDDKRFANRRWRRAVKWAIQRGADIMPLQREVSNVWTFGKDGKGWWGGTSYEQGQPWWEKTWWEKLWRK